MGRIFWNTILEKKSQLCQINFNKPWKKIKFIFICNFNYLNFFYLKITTALFVVNLKLEFLDENIHKEPILLFTTFYLPLQYIIENNQIIC